MEKAVKTRPMAIGGTGAKVSRAVKTVVLFALLLVYLAPFILIIINSLKPPAASSSTRWISWTRSV